MVKNLLSPPHREGGNHDITTTLPGLIQNVFQLSKGIVHITVIAIAIGGLHHQQIRLVRCKRIIHQYRIGIAQITGKHQAFLAASFVQAQIDDG